MNQNQENHNHVREKVRINPTPDVLEVLGAYLSVIGDFQSDDIREIKERIKSGKEVNRNRIHAQRVDQGFFINILEDVGILDQNIDIELSNVSLNNFNIDEFALNLPEELKNILNRTLDYPEQKSKDVKEKINTFFKGNYDERSIDDHRNFVVILTVAFLIKIKKEQDIDKKIKLTEQLNTFTKSLYTTDLARTQNDGSKRLSLPIIIRNNIEDTNSYLKYLEAKKLNDAFKHNLKKFKGGKRLLFIANKLDNLILALLIPEKNIPKNFKADTVKYFAEFDKQFKEKDPQKNFKEFSAWLIQRNPPVNEHEKNILLNQQYYGIIRECLRWGSDLSDLCQQYSDPNNPNKEEVLNKIKKFDQKINFAELKDPIGAPLKGWFIDSNIPFPDELKQEIENILNIRFSLSKLSHTLFLIEELTKCAGEASNFFATEQAHLLFEKIPQCLHAIQVNIQNLETALLDFGKKHPNLDAQNWTFDAYQKVISLSNPQKFAQLLKDLSEAAQILNGLTQPKKINENFKEIKNLMLQLSSMSELLTEDVLIIQKIKGETKVKVGVVDHLSNQVNSGNVEEKQKLVVLENSYAPSKTDQIKQLNTENSDLKNQVTSLNQELGEVKKRNNKLENTMDEIKKHDKEELEKSFTIVRTEKEKLEIVKKDYEVLALEYQHQDKKLQTLKDEHTRTQEELDNKKVELTNTQTTLNNTNQALNTANEQKDAARNEAKIATQKTSFMRETQRLVVDYKSYSKLSRQFGSIFYGITTSHSKKGGEKMDHSRQVISDEILKEEFDWSYDALINAIKKGMLENLNSGQKGHSANTYWGALIRKLQGCHTEDKDILNLNFNELMTSVLNDFKFEKDATRAERDEQRAQNTEMKDRVWIH